MVNVFRVSPQHRGWRLAALSCGLWLCLAGCPAAAAEPSPQELALTRQLWERAVAAQEEANWASCEQALSQAVRIFETPGLRFHLAHCREMQAKWVEALVDYKRVDELLDSGVKAEDVAELLPQAIERLDAKIPKLTVRLEHVPKGTSLFINGRQLSLALLGKPIPLNPGSHTVALAADGLLPLSRRISLLESEARELVLTLGPVHPPTGPHALEAKVQVQADRAPFSAKPYVLALQALVAIGTSGVAAYYLAEAQHTGSQHHSELERVRRCQSGSLDCDDSELEQATSRAEGFRLERKDDQTSAWVWGAAGGVAVTSLLVTWLLWPEAESSTDQFAEQKYAKSPFAQWHAQAFYGGGKVTFGGVF